MKSVRQVQDLPERNPLIITDHNVWACACDRCGATTNGTFPEDVKASVQYGHRMKAMLDYLSVVQLLPGNRLVQAMNTMFGVSLSEGTVYNGLKSRAHHLQPVHAALRDLVRDAPVKHADETGTNINGSLRWSHVGSTESFCYFGLGKSRSDVMTDRVGIVVHDHWPSYLKRHPKVQHAYCLAHLVRECKGIVELGEDWAKDRVPLFYEMMEADAKSRQDGCPIPEKDIVSMEERFDRFLQAGLDDHRHLDPLPRSGRGRKRRRHGHNLLRRLLDNREGTLLFRHHLEVPAQNNRTERNLRCLKRKQKISGCFRTTDGAHDFAILRSVMETARKLKWNILDTLETDATELLAKPNSEGPLPDS